MNRLRIGIIVLIAALMLAGSAGRAAPPESRVALVVGNSAYRNVPPLRNPLNDARDMSKALRELGFEVIHVENANKQQLEHAIGQFSAKLKEGSVGLFYYSGHGMQANGHNYLIPVDAELAHETSVMLETVDVDVLLELMNMAQTRVNLLILDACRTNPFERRFRALGRGLAPVVLAPRGTLVAYSTAPGKVASDGDGANGLYTAELLKAMRQPGLTVEDVFKRVRVAVGAATSDEQTPWEMSSLTGDFYFRPPGSSALPVGGQPVQPVAGAPAAPSTVPAAPVPVPSATQAALLTPPTASIPPSSTEEIAFRCPREGTLIQYDNGWSLSFKGASGFRCAYSDAAYKPHEKFAGFGDDAKLLDAGLDKLWPLKVGKTQRFVISGSGAYLSETFSVLRRETMTVGAGTFDTFVVEWEELGRTINGYGDGTRFAPKRLFWFEPTLGLIVKSTSDPMQGFAPNGTLLPGDYAAVRIAVAGVQ